MRPSRTRDRSASRVRERIASSSIDEAVAAALLRRGTKALEAALAQRHAAGRAEGEAKAILAVLEARGVPVAEEARARTPGCYDPALLRRWLPRAITAAVDDLLADG